MIGGGYEEKYTIISGLSKKTIDEVTQNVVKEMVRGMVGKEKADTEKRGGEFGWG